MYFFFIIYKLARTKGLLIPKIGFTQFDVLFNQKCRHTARVEVYIENQNRYFIQV